MNTSRTPAFAQGLTLISLVWVSTIAAVVIAPVLPQMRQQFADVARVDIKIALVATGPSLLVSLLSLPFGLLTDKVGRIPILLIALILYGFAGTAPLWLPDLNQIVTSRLALGFAEAAVLTTGTALISDYYQGRARERWLAAQAGIAPVTAVILALLGGLLGSFGWRTPYYVYGFGFMVAPAVFFLLWEPQRSKDSDVLRASDSTKSFRWSKPFGISLVVFFTAIMFMVTVIQFAFLVAERGMTGSQRIGLWSAAVTIANPIGAFVYSLIRVRTSIRLTIAYTLFTLGFVIMATGSTVPAAIVGAFIANLGAGFYMPTAIVWLLSTLPPALVGRGSGLWTSSLFLGQFLSPLVVLGLTQATGTLSHAILSCGLLCGAACVIALTFTLRYDRKEPKPV